MKVLFSKMRLAIFLAFGILLLQLTGTAQRTIRGKVFDISTDSTIIAVTIYNTNSRLLTQSGKDGRYQIKALEKDLIVFSSIGYKPDSLRVEDYMFEIGYDISLKLKPDSLSEVLITGPNYAADSLNRRNEYRNILDRPLPSITGGNTPQGFGISLSPFSYFSKQGREKRRFKQRLINQEKEAYVDYRFPRGYIQRLTTLSRDSLNTFMIRFRPSYEFCRKASDEDMLNYINQSYKKYRNPPVPIRKKRLRK